MNGTAPFKSIRRRILVITMSFTLAVALLTATYCYFSYRSLLYGNLKQSTEYNLQLLAENIQYDMNSALSMADFCTFNSTIASYLKSSNQHRDNTSTLANHAWERLQEYYRANGSSRYISRIIVSDLQDNYIQIASANTFRNVPCARLIREQPYFRMLLDSDSQPYIQTGLVPDPITTSYSESLVIPIIRPIYSTYDQSAEGWCYVAVSPALFIKSLHSYSLPDDCRLFVTIGPDTYLWADGSLTPSELPEPRTDFLSLPYQVSYAPGSAGWSVTQTLSRQALATQTSVYMSALILIIGILSVLGISLTLYIRRTITIPITHLQKKLQVVAAGDFSPDPAIEWNNELGEIGRGINDMGRDISQLIQHRMEDQEKKYELEYQILQNQVNPHFLYNTLNSIIWMATVQGADGIVEMATSLSALLKAISKKSAEFHTLRDELELLRHYFLIQKYRYGGGLTMEVQVDSPELYDCIVLKFILQIVVENAIFHGIEPKGSPGVIHIRVSADEEGQTLLLSVTDNGIGMTEEQIRRTLEHTPDSSDLFRKIGINNIQKRIQYAYGDSYGIRIESVPGEYTAVRISIPCRRKEGDAHV